MARGDHLRAARATHHHDGIDIGDGQVAHFAPDAEGSKATAFIRVTSFEEFSKGDVVTVRTYAGERDPDVIVDRALSRVGESNYNLVFNNCEHFARWCVTGEHRSEQVIAATSAGVSGLLPGVSGALGLSLVSSLGFAGSSGAGLMSGIATVGAVVGGGVIVGISLTGAVPGVIGIAFVSGHRFSDDEHLPAAQRRARRAGKFGGLAAGGLAGLVGVPWAISALGVPGVSAAGITSGLATIGGLAGGGMASGVVLAVAAPVAGVVLGAYLLHWLWAWAERIFERRRSAAVD